MYQLEQHHRTVLDEAVPQTHLLSNGRLTTLVTGAGAGFVRLGPMALTRWAPDRTRDADGYFFYLRDRETGAYWSAGHQPVQAAAERYVFHAGPGRVRLGSVHDDIGAMLEVCVVPEADLDLRRLTLTNHGDRPRRLDVTSYAEAVLNTPAADAGHPAFSKLFVQTEKLPSTPALLAQRRLRSPDDPPGWLIHFVAGADLVGFETDRMRFLGRGRTPAAPRALDGDLTGTAGNVLDSIVSLRCEVGLAPGETRTLVFGLGGGSDEATVRAMPTCFAEESTIDAAFAAAQQAAEERLAALSISAEEAQLFQRLTQALLYDHPAFRAAPAVLHANPGIAADLSGLGLQPDRRLVLLHHRSPHTAEDAEVLCRAVAHWQVLGLDTQLAIFVEGQPEAVAALADTALLLDAARLSEAQQHALAAQAALLLDSGLQALKSHFLLDRHMGRNGQPASPPMRPLTKNGQAVQGGLSDEELLFQNEYGGFSADGREYVIRVQPDAKGRLRRPPLPWTNCLANEHHGGLVTESGAGYTWSANSRENRLTPWHNDPVSDPHGEALYLRDEATGACWSPTPGPVPAPAAYEVRHGFGYTCFTMATGGLRHETTYFVPRHDPVKVIRFRLTNAGDAPRPLSIFGYQQLVLGVDPFTDGRMVTVGRAGESGSRGVFEREKGEVGEREWETTGGEKGANSRPSTADSPTTHTLTAINPNNGEFAGRVAFGSVIAPADAEVRQTGDRKAFLGRHGRVTAPAALRPHADLEERFGAGLDPCFAHQVRLTLAPGATVEIVFLLGQMEDRAEIPALAARYTDAAQVDTALVEIQQFWRDLVGQIQVETPVPEIDVMVNGWLTYQNLACRMWARSAYYQAGGAYGFRDQLQDSSALIYLWPDLTRQQILRHAAHQFVEGDVLHWWHPPTSKGIRTRFSDDLLWLPYVTAYYVQTTGDAAVLDEDVRFLTARLLEDGEDEAFLFPEDAGVSASVYEHCCRALDRSLTKGPHGLPLMGTGDWNDGMNRVGREGRGESVWLGFFLYHILGDFLYHCAERGDLDRMDLYGAYRDHLRHQLNDTGWDGAWYRRAYYDNGAPLGSAENDECRIDALAQAWAVLSGVASEDRAAQALDAMEEHLVAEDDGLIRLLAPAFDKTPHDPGYIKGYLPGVRENGGQYTHAALWAVRALAEAGRGDRAGALLRMISPVTHAQKDVACYRTEPYVIAADVYGVAPHIGRGGWTWYTGSAGWMYRVALESLLGLTLRGGHTLVLNPCIPAGWPGFRLRYQPTGHNATYEITVTNPNGVCRGIAKATCDGEDLDISEAGAHVPLASDGGTHQVRVVM